MNGENHEKDYSCARPRILAVWLLLALLLSPLHSRADEPYARSRDYDLQHSKITLRFDTDERKVYGEVTHSLTILRDGTTKIVFDSVGLTIHNVTLNKSSAKFETTSDRLILPLATAAKAGDKFEVNIRYEGKPHKGIYFILPDKSYPTRPTQVWSQGESEDTRYYLPTYDYPNDRLTTETLRTVPSSWTTVANGKLISVTDAPKGLKTWYWKESVPSSTYLITAVAGEFDEVKDTWHGIPLTYYAPKGRGDRIKVTYSHTPAMMELFTRKLGVDYPWEKYAQVMVDEFVAGGMENSSATTNTSNSLTHPKLAPEYSTGEDDLISHELGHQWFGDLVTCKDWGDIWLNEGFATFMEAMWNEAHYGKDEADYKRWNASREWMQSTDLWNKPIVRHDFDDSNSNEFDDNAYNKGGWVLYMLRHELGEELFYRSLKHYLEINRGKNVVTADFAKAIEETTHTDVDRFFNQWLYGAGAPKFDVSYTYDGEKRQISLNVKETQEIEGHVAFFRVPVDVEVTTAAGPKLYNITVWKANQTVSLPADSVPLMVLFDKGNQILKSLEFHKEKKEWLYQLKNAADLADRADAAVALGKIKGDEEAVSALGDALQQDKAWGVRAVAADKLGQLGGSSASKFLLNALEAHDHPWVRTRVVAALANFKDDPAVLAKLNSIAKHDDSYRAQGAALEALGRLKAPDALATLTAAIATDSPDDFLRNAALRSLGSLGDEKAVPLLLQWSALGKPIDSRSAAIYSLARLDKTNKDITKQIADYLVEPYFSVRLAAIYALGGRGDSTAVPPLEALLKQDNLSIEMVPTIKRQIARLKNSDGAATSSSHGTGSEADHSEKSDADKLSTDQRLDKLQHLLEEMDQRLKSVEKRLPPPPKP